MPFYHFSIRHRLQSHVCHKHYNEYANCGVRRGAIGVASVVGIDDYSMRIRKSADASASLICYEENKGKVADFTIVLN